MIKALATAATLLALVGCSAAQPSGEGGGAAFSSAESVVPEVSEARPAVVAYSEQGNRLFWLDGRGTPTLVGGRTEVALAAVPADLTTCGGSVVIAFADGDLAALSAADGRQVARSAVMTRSRPGMRDLLVDGVGCRNGRSYVFGSFSRPGRDVFESFLEVRDPDSLALLAEHSLEGVVQDGYFAAASATLLLDDGHLYDVEALRDLGRPFDGAAQATDHAAGAAGGGWYALTGKDSPLLRTPSGTVTPLTAEVTDLEHLEDGVVVTSATGGTVERRSVSGGVVWSVALPAGPYVSRAVGDTLLVGQISSDQVVSLDLETGRRVSSSTVGRGVVRLAALS